MPVYVGPVPDHVQVGDIYSNRRVVRVRYFPSPTALVRNHNLKEWDRLHPNDPIIDPPGSGERLRPEPVVPLRWAQVVQNPTDNSHLQGAADGGDVHD